MVRSCNEVTASIHVQVMIWIESVAKPRPAYLGGKMHAFVAIGMEEPLAMVADHQIHPFQSASVMSLGRSCFRQCLY